MERSQSSLTTVPRATGIAPSAWGHDRGRASARPGGEGVPDFELIVRQPRQSFRWTAHDYPHPVAKWHYHPEYELHLIQKTSGKMFVGDFIGNFEPGNLVLTGPNLPHNWVSDLPSGELVRDRDMLIQFSDDVVREMMRVCLEFEEIEALLDDARYGIAFHGETARFGWRALKRIGQAEPTRRILLFLELLDVLNRSGERRILSSRNYAPTLDHGVSDTINRAIDYLISNLTGEICLSDVARQCGMSDSAFSRFFKKNTGHGFVRYLNRMRINRASMLLAQSDMAISGHTPSEYRRQAKRNRKKSAAPPLLPIG